MIKSKSLMTTQEIPDDRSPLSLITTYPNGKSRTYSIKPYKTRMK